MIFDSDAVVETLADEDRLESPASGSRVWNRRGDVDREVGMQFVSAAGGVWHLIDENAPPDANLIAVLRGPVEVLAIKELCEALLRPGGLAAKLEFAHEGRLYRVTPFSDREGRLSLRIDGDDGSLSRVETEFGWADEATGPRSRPGDGE